MRLKGFHLRVTWFRSLFFSDRSRADSMTQRRHAPRLQKRARFLKTRRDNVQTALMYLFTWHYAMLRWAKRKMLSAPERKLRPKGPLPRTRRWEWFTQLTSLRFT